MAFRVYLSHSLDPAESALAWRLQTLATAHGIEMYVQDYRSAPAPAGASAQRAIDRSEIKGAVIQKLIDDMIDTMVEYHGVGLAAPQDHEGVRLFVAALDADTDEGERREPVAIINPEITPVGAEIVEDWEGCLSIPDIRGRVPRARAITVRAFDRKGDRIEINAHDFAARVIQHETDHLDGVLFLDRMTSFETLTYLDEFSRYWSREDVKAE